MKIFIIFFVCVTLVMCDKCDNAKESFLQMKNDLMEKGCDYVTSECDQCECDQFDKPDTSWLTNYYTKELSGYSVPE